MSDSYKFKRENAGFLYACLWIIALAGFMTRTLPNAHAQDPDGIGPPPAGGHPGASFQTTVVQGTVAQYLTNPDGVVDGLLLTNNTIVRFPPHLGQVLAQTVNPQDVVRVEGSFEVPGTIHASSIVDLQSQRSVVDMPPSPKHPRPPRPDSVTRKPLSASGTIRVLTHAKHGEIDIAWGYSHGGMQKRAEINFCFLGFQVFFTPRLGSVPVTFGCICLLFC